MLKAMVALFVWASFFPLYGEDALPAPGYVVDIGVYWVMSSDFVVDTELSTPDHLVGIETSSYKPHFVLLLGDKPKTPKDKCRAVYVTREAFQRVRKGKMYQPQKSDLAKPPEKPSVKLTPNSRASPREFFVKYI